MVEKSVTRTRKSLRLLLILGGLAGLVAAISILGPKALPYLRTFAEWVEGLGFWAPIIYILGYATLTVVMVPGSPLTISAGPLFGILQGTLYAFLGATAGACSAFLVARYVARGAIERRLEGNAKFMSIDRAIRSRGFFLVLLLRLSPVFPFNLINVGLGLTKVRFHHFALASIGMLPGTLLYVYIGYAAGDIATALSGQSERQKTIFDYALLIMGLVATLVVTTWVTRLARNALKEATGDGDTADSAAG
ncbi:MAG: TVP38/TMEM64 family protein [Planctomycetota bacterium]|nr:TVP38/TMEM64 family protein [Planctomycetota bacterium]